VSDGDALQARKRIRNGALRLMTVALAFYVAFIAIAVYRSHH
jgi:hypothetical protein